MRQISKELCIEGYLHAFIYCEAARELATQKTVIFSYVENLLLVVVRGQINKAKFAVSKKPTMAIMILQMTWQILLCSDD